jgi:hypothetical protein
MWGLQMMVPGEGPYVDTFVGDDYSTLEHQLAS